MEPNPLNPIASASMATAVDVAREVSPTSPIILWPADWPAPELVAWTLAQMLAETLPCSAPANASHAPWAARGRAGGKREMVGATGIEPVTPTMST